MTTAVAGERIIGQVEPWQDLSDNYRAAAARMIEFHIEFQIVGPVRTRPSPAART